MTDWSVGLRRLRSYMDAYDAVGYAVRMLPHNRGRVEELARLRLNVCPQDWVAVARHREP